MHHHEMLWSLTRCVGPQKALSCLSEGYICRIVDMTFAEFTFHALG
jgi:rRNA processing protein Krr1/Pno1